MALETLEMRPQPSMVHQALWVFLMPTEAGERKLPKSASWNEGAQLWREVSAHLGRRVFILRALTAVVPILAAY